MISTKIYVDEELIVETKCLSKVIVKSCITLPYIFSVRG